MVPMQVRFLCVNFNAASRGRHLHLDSKCITLGWTEDERWHHRSDCDSLIKRPSAGFALVVDFPWTPFSPQFLHINGNLSICSQHSKHMNMKTANNQNAACIKTSFMTHVKLFKYMKKWILHSKLSGLFLLHCVKDSIQYQPTPTITRCWIY